MLLLLTEDASTWPSFMADSRNLPIETNLGPACGAVQPRSAVVPSPVSAPFAATGACWRRDNPAANDRPSINK
jgi:hypothetical protein